MRGAAEGVERAIAGGELGEPFLACSAWARALVGRLHRGGKRVQCFDDAGEDFGVNGDAAPRSLAVCSVAIRLAASSRPSAARIAIGMSPVVGLMRSS